MNYIFYVGGIDISEVCAYIQEEVDRIWEIYWFFDFSYIGGWPVWIQVSLVRVDRILIGLIF